MWSLLVRAAHWHKAARLSLEQNMPEQLSCLHHCCERAATAFLVYAKADTHASAGGTLVPS